MIEHKHPASVAKIKSRDHAPAALPHSPWRVYLKHLARWMLIALVIAFMGALWLALIAAAHQLEPRGRMINCSLAEFHPDFTPAMREACRKARHA